MTKEKITKILNQVFIASMVLLVVWFIMSSINSDNKKVNFMEKYDAKADSLFRMQTEYKKLLQESNLKIQALSEERQTIIEKQPQIYNRYVTKYITNLNPADSSAFNAVYEQSVHEFDSLWQSGFFVTK